MNFNRFDVKTIKTFELGRKTTKVIKLQWIASIWRQNDQNFWVTSLNYKRNQITMNCMDLMSKLSEMLSYVAKHSKQRKTTKVIKLQWIASIWCQKHQTNAKLQKWSYFDEFQSIWRQNYQNIWVRSQNYKSNQITMDCIDLTSKRSKLLSYVPKLQSNRITINCIDLMPKRSRMLSYVAKHSKQRKTTKVIKLQWIASIWRQNDHNNAKLRKWSNYNALHRFDVKTIKNVEVRRKTFKTTQNYKWNQITMNLIDLTSERSKMLSYVAKLQMWSYYDEFASIWRQNDHNNA